jgi:predicted RND superfamily exporter protein
MKKEKTLAWIKVCAFFCLTIVFAYFFTQTKRGGIMDDALLNKGDPFYQMDQRVKSLASEGLNVGEAINFILPLKDLSPASLGLILSLTEDLKKAFPEYGVISLSTAANYSDTGKALNTEPHISQSGLGRLKDGSLALTDWQKDIRKDIGVYGLLISRNFEYATIYLMLPQDYDEISTFRRIVELLEQRKISRLEWYLKKNIVPAGEFADVKVGGWVMARGLMDAALNADILMLSTIGLVITWLVFIANFVNLRQATLASLTVLLGLIWTNGTVGLMQALGFKLYERVYFLLVFTAVIVAGISFVARLFEKYNELRDANSGLSRPEIWQIAGKSIRNAIVLTAIIAIANFGTMYQIRIRGILEVGIFAAFGILYLLALSLILLPALHILVGGDAKASTANCYSRFWHDFLVSAVDLCYKFCDRNRLRKFDPSGPMKASLGVLVSTVIIALLLISLGLLKINTRPIEYVKGTIIDQASQLMNKPGNAGFDRISFLVKARADNQDQEPISNPRFIAEVMRFKQAVLKLDSVREVNSPIDTVSVITNEIHSQAIPPNAQIAHEAFIQMEADLDPVIKEQLWYQRGIVFYVSSAADDSNDLGMLNSQVIKLAKDRFPKLEVLSFGKLNLYPRADEYIRLGKPLNVLTSQWVVFAIYAIWIAWHNRRKKCFASYRLSAWRGGLVMNAPFIFATSAITIVMVVFKVPLDQATACISALAINAAADFGLYLVDDYREQLDRGSSQRRALQFALLTNGHIIVADVLLNAICFAPLMLSGFLPVIRLGWIMVVMLLACGFGALVLMPALLPWAVVKRN